MSKYSELVERINGRPNDAPVPSEYLLDEASDAIIKLEAEKAELVECVKLLMGRCGPLASDGRQARQLLAKLEAGQ